jgi:hypothetical protein
MPRQIIKTRPQTPYVVARIVIALIIIALGAALAWFETHRVAHAALTGQEPIFTSLNSSSPVNGRQHQCRYSSEARISTSPIHCENMPKRRSVISITTSITAFSTRT